MTSNNQSLINLANSICAYQSILVVALVPNVASHPEIYLIALATVSVQII